MSEQISVSPLLDGFTIGSSVSRHHGTCCYPAVKANTDRKYILKVISVPASQTQLEALLITGAYKTPAEAAEYFRSLTDSLIQEVAFLRKMARLKGFLPYEGFQFEPMGKNLIGYNIYLLSGFRLSLDRYIRRQSVTHLEAINLGIDLCEALAACRKEGMLYIDLKPSNIFISSKKEYKIGDIGFVPLASLKYSSMPEKYRSRYCPPELLDDLSVLNSTADTYALGMILYQLFNNGVLPSDPAGQLPAPCNADEEITRIILKACAPKPEDRWSDPTEMGQALIDYMQVGTINDTPIMVPIKKCEQQNCEESESSPPAPDANAEATVEEPVEPPAAAEVTSETPAEAETQSSASSEEPEPAAPAEEPEPAAPAEEPPASEPENSPAQEPALPSEEPAVEAEAAAEVVEETPTENIITDDVTLSASGEILTEDNPFFTPETPPADVDPFATSEDVQPVIDFSSALEDVPPAEKPAAATEQEETNDYSAIDRNIETAADEEFAAMSGQSTSPTIDDVRLDHELEELQQILSSNQTVYKPFDRKHPNLQPVIMEEPTKKKKSPAAIFISLLVFCLIAAACFWGYLFYQTEYLKTIHDLRISGSLDEITVTIDSDIPDNLLNVTCTDTYGHSQRTFVRDGKATFRELSPDSLYKIQVGVNGVHKLVGKTSDIFTTDSVTNVVSFTVCAGQEDGSAVVNLIVDGHEPDQWQIVYTAPGEPELGHTFSGHTTHLNNLVLGKKYTFRLETSKHQTVNGQTTAELTASRLILPTELSIVSCQNGQMVVRWNSAEEPPSGWRAYCSGDNYDQVLECTGNEAIFTGIDTAKAYTVEVIANGMSQGSHISISANPITLSNLEIDTSNPQELLLSWEYEGDTPQNGWLVQYTLDGSNLPSVMKAEGPSISIGPRIPGAVYHFSIQAADGGTVFNGQSSFNCPAAENFYGYGLYSHSITSKLLVTPETENWAASMIGANDYASSFTAGQPISMVLHCRMDFLLDNDSVNLLFVFRDQNGNALAELISEQTVNWRDFWLRDDYHYGELDISPFPTRPGGYTLSVYLNGTFLTEAALTVS